MVLAHHLTRTTIWLRLARSLCYLSLFSVIHCAFAGQVVLNGQIHTDGLSIIDSPQPNTPIHAGSNLDISVDISGNGKIPPPRSNYPTRFDSLQVYLTSDYAKLNLTVSGRSELLDGKTGTVGHFNWFIPTCLPPDGYNLTFYETFHLNDTLHFTITPIPVSILNDHPTAPCTEGLNTLDNAPQPSNPLAQPPFLPNQPPPPAAVAPGSAITPSIPPPVTVTAFESHSTVTIVSTITTVFTEPSETYTTTILTTRTTTQVQNTQDVSGLVPVNGSSASLPSVFFSHWWILVAWVSVAVFGPAG